MFEAFAQGRQDEFLKFDELKVELLLTHGTPKDHLWLTDLDLTKDGKGILFYHESGNMLSYGIFELDSVESFEEACKEVSRYFTGDEPTNNEKGETELKSLFDGTFIEDINFKIDTDRMLAFEFRAAEEVYIEEGDFDADTFRIEYFKESKQIYVATTFDEDYDVGEEITHLCDTKAMFEYCLEKDKTEEIEDHTEEYIQHCEGE
ncbi:hypothetical protein QTG56_24505 (plasmid) [Rossellomorea sp. AcN35-11]|nr:hypothetical protein [Rossellomorea aquimaris]WJV31797.1 hypothetical protein QTG56_24505 [Rossellomorea sp. AcN35-11]